MATLDFIFNVLKVVIGLGFVIFIHELGHFLVAKWSGVYCKSFSIGFPPTIWKKKWGETEYKIGLLFLGGYVSMLGEGPESEDDPEAAENPRSFKNQTVGEKVAILSAGVVMNLILGLAVFTSTHLMGVEIVPAKIGAVSAGSPAYEAGLRTGDHIVTINGDDDVDYLKLKVRVSLSAAGQVLEFGVKRPGVDGIIPIKIQPKRQGSAEMPNIGVLQSLGLEVAIDKPFEAPGGMKEKAPTSGEFKGLDAIVAAGVEGGESKPITTIDELDRFLVENRAKPVSFKVKHNKEIVPEGGEATVVLPPNHLVRFGFRNGFGPIKAIQGNSIAAKAGFKVGDRIVKVDGRDDVDPFDLPYLCFDKAGQAMKFTVVRQENGKDAEVEITATPDKSLPWSEFILPNEPFEAPGLGLAFEVDPKVVAVTPGSEAEKQGVKPGQAIKQIELVGALNDNGKPAEPISLDKVPAWPSVFDRIQREKSRAVKFTFSDLATAVTITPTIDPTSFHPTRGLNRISLREAVPPQPFAVAIHRGFDDTVDNILSIYAMIRSLWQGRVSTSNLAGLPRIAGMAYQSASAGIVALLQFLGMLSINLAVLNFMPIPPLDGGQITLILAEKVRGRPIPPGFFNAVMLFGFILIVALMLFTNGQDIWILVRGK